MYTEIRCDGEYQSHVLLALVRHLTRSDPALTDDATWYVEVTLSADVAVPDDNGYVVKGFVLGVVELNKAEWIAIAPTFDDDDDPGRRQLVPPVLIDPNAVTDFLIP